MISRDRPGDEVIVKNLLRWDTGMIFEINRNGNWIRPIKSSVSKKTHSV